VIVTPNIHAKQYYYLQLIKILNAFNNTNQLLMHGCCSRSTPSPHSPAASNAKLECKAGGHIIGLVAQEVNKEQEKKTTCIL
jgi:hypothetical protein